MKYEKKILFVFSVVVIIIFSSCNEKAQKEKGKLDSTFQSVIKESPDSSSEKSVQNKSFVTSTGEKVQRFEVILNTSIGEVWDAFTTEKGLKSWAVPVVQLDFRIGGTRKAHYNKNAQIGDDFTITNDILNYLPKELLTYKVNLTKAFPKECRDEDDHLQYMLQFRELNNKRVKITFSMLGWGEGPEWEEVYDKFERGNRWTFERLVKRFKTGRPVDWK